MTNLELKYKEAVIKLPLSDFVTVLTGLSGSGKSLICDALVYASKTGQLDKPIHRVIPDNYSTFSSVPTSDKALLVIDNADLLFAQYPAAAEQLNSLRYQAVVVARDTHELRYPLDCCGIIRQNKNVFSFVPITKSCDYR